MSRSSTRFVTCQTETFDPARENRRHVQDSRKIRDQGRYRNTLILSAVRAIAVQEGRQLQALVDEALADLIEKRRQAGPRPQVMAAHLASHDKYGELYKKLAR